MAPVIPTKGNLIAIRRSMTLARMGFELMDRKRNILIREMMGLIDRASEIQSEIDVTFRQAYAALQIANITLGIADTIAEAVPVDDSVLIRYHSVMGVELPSVPENNEPIKIEYGLTDTNSMLDEAYKSFHAVKRLTRTLAEIEISIYRLAYSIKKTQKRANALENIIIPNLNSSIRFITGALEEKDREEFVRLKVIKGQH